MSLSLLQDILLRCLLINYGIVTIWFVAFRVGHDRLFSLHGHWFNLSRERFDAIHYAGMAFYKIGILLLNLTPYIALHLINTPAASAALMPGP